MMKKSGLVAGVGPSVLARRCGPVSELALELRNPSRQGLNSLFSSKHGYAQPDSVWDCKLTSSVTECALVRYIPESARRTAMRNSSSSKGLLKKAAVR